MDAVMFGVATHRMQGTRSCRGSGEFTLLFNVRGDGVWGPSSSDPGSSLLSEGAALADRKAGATSALGCLRHGHFKPFVYFDES